MLSKLQLLALGLLTVTQFNYGEDKCTDAGRQCSEDCTKVLFCPSGSGEEPSVIDTCTGKAVCDEATTQCKDGGSCNMGPDLLPVLCGESGIIPDIFNCSNYYFCSEPNVAPETVCTCSEPEVFNQQTNKCEDSQSLTCLPLANINCTNAGDCDEIPYDTVEPPSAYYAYICVDTGTTLVPEIFSCKGNLDADCKCNTTKPFQNFKTDSKTVSCSPYVPPPEVTTPGPPTTIPPGETKPTCTQGGQTFPHEDCTKFWLCYSDLEPHLRTCPSGSHFDQQQENCVSGTC